MVATAAVARRIDPVEAFEQHRQMRLVDCRAWVAHGDADLSVALFDAHLDDLLGGGVLHGVVEQVDQCPA
ncbi:hypothetical protein D3C76_1857870 [compost metagenome]